jgi:hypothetical protein
VPDWTVLAAERDRADAALCSVRAAA